MAISSPPTHSRIDCNVYLGSGTFTVFMKIKGSPPLIQGHISSPSAKSKRRGPLPPPWSPLCRGLYWYAHPLPARAVLSVTSGATPCSLLGHPLLLLYTFSLRNFIHVCGFLFLMVFFTYFRERGRKGERRKRETSICKRYTDWLPLARPHLGTWPTTQACVLTRNWTRDLLVHRPDFNPLSHTSQGHVRGFSKSHLQVTIFRSDLQTLWSRQTPSPEPRETWQYHVLLRVVRLGQFTLPLRNPTSTSMSYRDRVHAKGCIFKSML